MRVYVACAVKGQYEKRQELTLGVGKDIASAKEICQRFDYLDGNTDDLCWESRDWYMVASSHGDTDWSYDIFEFKLNKLAQWIQKSMNGKK